MFKSCYFIPNISSVKILKELSKFKQISLYTHSVAQPLYKLILFFLISITHSPLLTLVVVVSGSVEPCQGKGAPSFNIVSYFFVLLDIPMYNMFLVKTYPNCFLDAYVREEVF